MAHCTKRDDGLSINDKVLLYEMSYVPRNESEERQSIRSMDKIIAVAKHDAGKKLKFSYVDFISKPETCVSCDKPLTNVVKLDSCSHEFDACLRCVARKLTTRRRENYACCPICESTVGCYERLVIRIMASLAYDDEFEYVDVIDDLFDEAYERRNEN